VRVLYVNHTAAVSGAERSLLTLLAGLPPEVQARVATPPGPLAQAVQRLGVPTSAIASTAGSLRLHPKHTPRALAEMGAAALQVARAARDHRAEVVHANSIRAGLELTLAPVGGAAKVVSVRDCLPPSATAKATMRIIARTSRCVIANSAYTAELVRRAAPAAQLEVLYPAIDAERFDPARIERAQARARLGATAGSGRVLLGVVAQLTPWKGQDTAIEAVGLLREEGIDAQLLLIGSAKFVSRATRFDNEAYVASLRRLIATRGLEDRVTLLGERRDVPELIRALDVLLLPSHEEPFGRALLEAMALEVPVVATSVGGSPELVREGREGALAPPRDPQAWARAVRRVLESPDGGRALGRAGRSRVVESFSVHDHVQAALELYECAAGSNQEPARA
jgi:glycosyltransferase involved in cell wall biosynthesis